VGSHWGENGANSAVERFAGPDHQIWPNDQAPLDGAGQLVHALAADDQGGIWVARNNGVERWDGQKWTGWSSGEGAPANDIFAALWLATDDGLLRYGP
jgi:ligand-binding sensor domain-containing protein